MLCRLLPPRAATVHCLLVRQPHIQPRSTIRSRTFTTPTTTQTASASPTTQPATAIPVSSEPSPTAAPLPSTSVPDLSHISKPLGALYPLFTPSRTTLSPHLLTPQQLAHYTTHGYITNLPCLTVEQCDALLADYNRFLQWDHTNSDSSGGSEERHAGLDLFHEFHSNQTGDPQNVLCHGLGQWRVSPLFHDLIFHPALTVRVAQCLAATFTAIPNCPVRPVSTGDAAGSTSVVPVSFWHDQLFAKPPTNGGNVAWHQDYSYWTRTAPMNHITVHIALDEQTLDNGTLQFIPGSHHWTRPSADTDNNNQSETNISPLPIPDINFIDMDAINHILKPHEKLHFKPTPALLRRGEMSIHHPLTVHGSYPNRSKNARRATVVNYFVSGTQSRTDEALLAGVEPIGYGKELKGRFFPQVFRPEWLA